MSMEVGEVDEVAALEKAPASPAARKLRAFARNRAAVAGLAVALLLAVAATFAPLVATHDPHHQDHAQALSGPTRAHWFGTDLVGRDVYSNVVHGGRVSLPIGIVSVGIALSAGVLLGGTAAYRGGILDALVFRAMDVLLAFPPILLALLIVTMLGRGTWKVMIAVGIAEVPRFARQMRAEVLALKEREFVLASRALGAGWARILFGRILPNSLGPMSVIATLGVATAVLEAAGLGFLGLGADAQSPEWGTMLADNRDKLGSHWWLAVFPGAAIAVTVLALNLVGDGVRDAFDPKTGREGR